MSVSKFIKAASLGILALSATALASTAPFQGVGEPDVPQVVRFAEASAEATFATGSFKGRSKHITSGEAHILKTRSGYALVLSDNFFLDGAPAPVLGFGNNGKYDKSSTFADLEANKGRQVYPLPAGLTPANFNEVYVWCEDFSIPLGVAKLTFKTDIPA